MKRIFFAYALLVTGFVGYGIFAMMPSEEDPAEADARATQFIFFGDTHGYYPQADVVEIKTYDDQTVGDIKAMLVESYEDQARNVVVEMQGNDDAELVDNQNFHAAVDAHSDPIMVTIRFKK